MILPAEQIETNQRQASIGLDAYRSSFGEAVGASAEEAWATNPTVAAWQLVKAGSNTLEMSSEFGSVPIEAAKPVDQLSAEDAAAKYGIDGELKFDQPISESVAKDFHDAKRAELKRKDILARSDGGFMQSAASFGASMGVSLLDPLNIASAFIPVVGPTRYALALERAGSGLARAAIRARVGALEGAVGAAVVEPLVYGAATQRQADYDGTDSLLNIAFGTVLGGGLHTGLGAVGDAIKRRGLAEPMLRDSVAAVVEDRPVRVEGSFKAALLGSAGRSFGDVFDSLLPPEIKAGGVPGAVDVPGVSQPQGQAVPTIQVAADTSRAEMRIFATEREATDAMDSLRVAARVVETPDGFSLVRDVPAEPDRMPTGEVRSFPNTRSADRYVSQQGLKGEASVVPFQGADGKLQYAVVRGLTERDAQSFATAPELVRFPEIQREAFTPRMTEPERVAQLAEVERTMRQHTAEAVGPGLRLEEKAHVAAIDEIVARAIAMDPVAQLAEIEADIAHMDGALKQAGIEDASLKQAGELVDLAERRAKAAEAAANCQYLRVAAE